MDIAIIGAGIAGLTAAAALRDIDGLHVRVFERTRPGDARSQGASLGLKGDAGWRVLEDLGIRAPLEPDARPIRSFLFADAHGRRLMALPASDRPDRMTVRVRRAELLGVLREAAGGDAAIESMRRATGIALLDDGAEVAFDDGSTIRADHVLAADGVHSAIRATLVGDARLYLGLTSLVGDAPIDVDDPLLAGGYAMLLGPDGTSVFVYREPRGMHLSYTLPITEGALDALTPEAMRERILAGTDGWAAPVRRVASALDPATLVVRGYYDREPLTHARFGRVWLLGDAAHPMSPFQGEGANTGMLDAWEVAGWLRTGADPATARGVERTMVDRGRKAVLASRSAAARFHATGTFSRASRDLGFRFADRLIALFAHS